MSSNTKNEANKSISDEKISKAKTLIADGKTRDAFKLMATHNKYKNTTLFLLLSSRYNGLRILNLGDLISEEKYRIKLNRINHNFLELLEDFPTKINSNYWNLSFWLITLISGIFLSFLSTVDKENLFFKQIENKGEKIIFNAYKLNDNPIKLDIKVDISPFKKSGTILTPPFLILENSDSVQVFTDIHTEPDKNQMIYRQGKTYKLKNAGRYNLNIFLFKDNNLTLKEWQQSLFIESGIEPNKKKERAKTIKWYHFFLLSPTNFFLKLIFYGSLFFNIITSFTKRIYF